jgi:hypothetical protein
MFYEDSTVCMSSFPISFKCSLDASKGIVCVCHLEKNVLSICSKICIGYSSGYFCEINHVQDSSHLIEAAKQLTQFSQYLQVTLPWA